MKCNSCMYEVMCYLRHNKYTELISIIAEITNAREPEYTTACNCIKSIFDYCSYWKKKK